MGSPPRVHDDDIGLQFTPTDVEPPPLSEDVVLHFAAILRALRRNEAAHVSAAAGELSLHDLRTWLEDLSLMTVPEAVAYVRELIAGYSRSVDGTRLARLIHRPRPPGGEPPRSSAG
jgi:hypothetical protein